MNETTAFEKWADAYRQYAQTGSELLWPSETLIRLFRGAYLAGMPQNYSGMSVVDVGCGNGNNLIFLASLGLLVAGTEVVTEICTRVSDRLKSLGYNSDIRVGTNRSLPFADKSYDFLVSWNVVHYEDNEQDIRDAFQEYARVLKPGGRALLSTTGPEHKILKDSERIGPHRYRIGRKDDFRRGQIFYYFDDAESVRAHMAPAFTDIQVGRTHDVLMTETLDWFVASGIKPQTK